MAIDLLEETLPHILGAMYPRRVPLLDWRMKSGEIPDAERTTFREKGWTEIRTPFEWGGYNKTVWFRTSMTVPDDFSGSSVAVRLRFPEALLYVNGKPVQGLDGNHTEAVIFEKVRRNQRVVLAIEANGGRTKEKHTFDLAELVQVNPQARALHSALTALRSLEQSLPSNDQNGQRVRELIRRTLIFVKYFAPEGEEYPNAIMRALTFLRQSVGSEFSSDGNGEIHLIGHSHIDLVWLWGLSETAKKTGRTFSSMLRLMDRFPNFRFTQGQAALYEIAQKSYPTVWSDIQKKVRDGLWNVVGSTWVEPDCNMPSGESLVRQILYGRRFFQESLGTTSDIFWMPDSFGFAASLPQILKRTGHRGFFTTKLRWNDTTDFPHTSFWWQGIDGTRILSHVPPLGLEADLTPAHLLQTSEALDEESAPLVIQTFGYGDGGGGVTAEQIESLEVLRDIPGLPHSTLSVPSEFFTSLESKQDRLPVWNGELYLERHRGTYTTHGWIKRANRDAESGLFTAESLAVQADILSGSRQFKYPVSDLEKAWKSLLFLQFHDILPGTFIRDVREEIQSAVGTTRGLIASSIQRACAVLTERSPSKKEEASFAVYNPTTSGRPAYIELTVPFSSAAYTVVSADGMTLEHQILGGSARVGRLLVYFPRLASLSFLNFVVRSVPAPTHETAGWKVSQKSVESPALRARFDNRGYLSSVYDRRLKKEILQKGKRGNFFQVFTDAASEWQTWDLDHDFERKKVETFSLKSSTVKEQGPLRATIHQEFRSENGSVIRQDIHFYHATPRIDFVTNVRWKESGRILKVAFPLAPRPTVATYEIPFAAIDRASRSKVPSDRAKFEVPAQRWASAGDSKFGAAILNDSKYGYDSRDHLLRLSLIRSPHYPHPTDPKSQTDTAVTDQGDHYFSYALYPFSGTWRQGNVVTEAASFNMKPILLEGVKARSVDPFMSVSKTQIAVSALKKAEDGNGYIVRAYEAHGQSADATFTFGRTVTGAAECDMLEQNEKILKPKKNRLSSKFKPFEVKTFRILFSGKIVLSDRSPVVPPAKATR